MICLQPEYLRFLAFVYDSKSLKKKPEKRQITNTLAAVECVKILEYSIYMLHF